jgi:integrase
MTETDEISEQVWNVAIEWGLLTHDPMPHVKQVRADQSPTRVLSTPEEALLLNACNSHLRPLVVFGLHTGLRAGELCSLTWEHIDVDRQLVRVVSGTAKSRRERAIPLTPTAWQVLEDRRSADASPEGRVFSYRSFASPFNAAVKRAGLQGVTPHTLRHTMATRALERGVNIRTVQRWLGHASVTQTERYTHPSPTYEREAILVLESQRFAQQPPSTVDGEARFIGA